MDCNRKNIVIDLFKSDYNIDLVLELLGIGEDPDLENSKGETLLHLATKSPEDATKIVRELIKADAEVNRSNRHSFKPLHFAVIYRKRRVVEALLQTKIDINSQDCFGKTALHYAVNNSYPNFRDLPLHSRVPDICIVRKLLDHGRINVSKKDIFGETPLITAVLDKNTEIVKLLLNRDSNLNASHEFGQTLLHLAMSEADLCPYIVVMLLLKRVSLLKMNYADETPLNIILKSKSFHFKFIYLKTIVFNYHTNGLLMSKLFKSPGLLKFLNRCFKEIDIMKRDTIANVLIVYDFVSKNVPKYGFPDPVLKVYKPIVKRLIIGLYPEYFYVLYRISKSDLFAVLKVTIIEKYCKKRREDKNSKKKHLARFSDVFKVKLLSSYLSKLDIFYLIVAFSRRKIDQTILNIRKHECYFTEAWEEYPEDYFSLKP